MKELIRNILKENLQQADKYYFNNKKLSPKVREIILKITNGDPYTKLITDIYYDTLYQNHKMGNWAISQIDDKHVETEHPENDILSIEDLRKIKGLHQELKNYNKNVFPIKGYNINGVENVPKFTQALKERKSIMDKLSTLPSVATRNLKNDIRLERDSSQLQSYRSSLEYFMALYSQLDNREPELRKNVENKMFKGESSLADWIDFADEKENLLGGGEFTKKQVKEIVNDSYYLDIVYSKGDIMIVEVSGAPGIKEIGCNSLWCFTYSGKHGNLGDWYNYSTNDLVYVIIDFSEKPDSPYFMHVLIKPIPEIYNDEEAQSTLFNMANQEVYDVSSTIEHFLPLDKAKKIMDFGIEPPKKPKEKKKKKKYVDPNQLSFQFESKLFIKKLLKEEFNKMSNELYGYHVTGNNPETLEKIKMNGFKIGNGQMEGEGFYGFYYLERAAGYSSKQGSTNRIIKFKIINPSKILFLDMNVAKELLGNEYHIANQLEKCIDGGLDFCYSDHKSVFGDSVFSTKEEYIKNLYEIEKGYYAKIGQEFYELQSQDFENSANVMNYSTYGEQYRINDISLIKPIGYYELEPFSKNVINYIPW